MAYSMRNEEIANQLDSDSDIEGFDEEGDLQMNFVRRIQGTPEKDISDKIRNTRKRKASTELCHNEGSKKKRVNGHLGSPPRSPVRKSMPKEKSLQGSSMKRKLVTNSSNKNKRSVNVTDQDKSIDELSIEFDLENEDRNNRTTGSKNKKSPNKNAILADCNSSNQSSPSMKRPSHTTTPLKFSSPTSKTIVNLSQVSVNLCRLSPDFQDKNYANTPTKNGQTPADLNEKNLKNKLTPSKNTHPEENNEPLTAPSRKSSRLVTELVAEGNCSEVNDFDPGKDKYSAVDYSNYEVDDQRKNNISTPDRKSIDMSLNDFKQTCTPKLNSGSSSNVNSSKSSNPLKKRVITVTTPISNKRTGRSLLTPGVAKRAVGGDETEGQVEDALTATRRQLHVSTVPRTLPCREDEFDHVKSFLVKKIEHGAGGCMYISGVPGTGKTATVHAVIRYLQEEVENEEMSDFDFVEINGLRLTEPKQAYVRILQSLTDQKQTAEQAQQTLNKRFSRKSNKATVILVDELDYLCNRRQDVVYNILEWSTSRSGVVVVAISNTMDLPERALKGRVTSRMGLTRLPFRPYTHKQLQLIVSQRLSDHPDAFHPDAVQFVARKVAAVSGDARRALDICRRTTELVLDGEQVTPTHVERALVQIFSGPRVMVIRHLPRLAQLVLRALRDTAERTGVEETTVAQMYKHLVNICTLEGCEVPSPGAVLFACNSLHSLGLVVGEKRRPDITRKLCLNVSSDDIHYALDNSGCDANGSR